MTHFLTSAARQFAALRTASGVAPLRGAACQRFHALGSVLEPENFADLSHYRVLWEQTAQGTIGRIEGLDGVKLRLPDAAHSGQTIEIAGADDEFELIAIHILPAAAPSEPICFRVRRQDAFAEESDAAPLALAAADYGKHFLEDETPLLFFSAVPRPGNPHRIRVHLVGTSALEGDRVAEWRFFDKHGGLVEPVDRRTRRELPVAPQRITFTPLEGRVVTAPLRSAIQRFDEAHPKATNPVCCEFETEIAAGFERGTWMELRIRPLSPAELMGASPLLNSFGLTRIDGTQYLVERPKRGFGLSFKSAMESGGWLLNTDQVHSLVERRVTEPLDRIASGANRSADSELAREMAHESLARELRRGEENAMLCDDDDKLLADCIVTLRRKRIDVSRSWLATRKTNGAEAPRILSMESEPPSPGRPAVTPWSIQLAETAEILRRVETNKRDRVLYWFWLWEQEAGEGKIADSAALAFGCTRKTVYQRIGRIRKLLERYA